MNQDAKKNLIPLTTGRNCKQAHNCEFREITADQYIQAFTKTIVGSKDGFWTIAGRFKNNHRSQANLIERQDLTYDIDHQTTKDKIKSAVSRVGFRALIHTTYSHGNPHEKWRIIFLLDRPIPGTEWKKIYIKIGEILDLAYDKTCADPARLFYTPRQPENPRLPFDTWTQDGTALIPSDHLIDSGDTQQEKTAKQDKPATRSIDSDPFSDKNKILRCAFIRHCLDDADILSEPEWYSMLTIIPKLDRGIDLAHEFSSPYPGYEKDETDKKILHAINDSGPVTCKRVSEITDNEYCHTCQHQVKSPIVLKWTLSSRQKYQKTR